MVKISSQDTNDSVVFTIMSVLTPDFTKKSVSILRNMIKGVAEVFNININQINEYYNDSFILTAEDNALDEVITDVSNIRRKNTESDEDYRNRYYKMIFQYDGTKKGIREAVYDITGEYPIQLLESNKRTAYWGQGDLAVEDQISGTAHYYTDTFESTPFWGENSNIAGFVGYIYLKSNPTEEQLNELINVLNYIKALGVTIYLVTDDFEMEFVEAPSSLTYTPSYTSFIANWS